MSFEPDSSLLAKILGKTVIITGGANGIGLETARQYYNRGANVVIADLPSARETANAAINELFTDPSRVLFAPTDITLWDDVATLFASAIGKFGRVDIVVANAGIMESTRFFDFETNDKGELKDDGFGRVIDVNLKGTMNTLRHAVFNMKENQLDDDGWRGSVVLISSTSGYFGGTGVVSYVSSKHGVTGLLRSSRAAAENLRVRVNCVAPLLTPTFITQGFSTAWTAEGLPTNTASDVAAGVLHMSLDQKMHGKCSSVIGGKYRELEDAFHKTSVSWTGEAIYGVFAKAAAFFLKVGGYPLPGKR